MQEYSMVFFVTIFVEIGARNYTDYILPIILLLLLDLDFNFASTSIHFSQYFNQPK